MTNPDPTVQSTEGFFQALFDMSFTNLITLRFLRVIYMIAVVFTGIGALIFVATSFSQNGGAGILALILVVPAWLLASALWIGRLLRLTPHGPEKVVFLRHRPVLSNGRLKEEFGFTPSRTSAEAFEEYLETHPAVALR